MPKRTKKKTESSNPFPYRKARVKIPRQIESAASLWLDFFQQFCDMVIDHEENRPVRMSATEDKFSTTDELAIRRARILADHALTAFQERFPGVHP